MWKVKNFATLTTDELYAIYYLRVKTFVVEQNRLYQEVDEIDKRAVHIFKMVDGEIVAYARIFKAGDHVSFGRVVVAKCLRGQHLGAALMDHILAVAHDQFAGESIQIEAQVQVQDFYKRYAFKTVGEPFLFQHTLHIKMIK